jgi:Ser/Thr protein kinase RdoA (MazF antagonist)
MAPSEAPDRAYHALGRRAQIERLRRLGRAALAGYGLEDAQLILLRHEHNTTFRVDGAGGPYVLRINRPGVHTPATIASEMAWLQAVRRDTGLGVPEPVAARDGSLVCLAGASGVPGPRVCVLLRRLEGRFVDEGLTPRHLRAVAGLQIALQDHAAAWTPPPEFVRPRVDTLTAVAKADSIAAGVAPPWHGDHPSREDADRSLQLVQELFAVGDAAILAAAFDVVWTTTRALAADPAAAGLIHGDLHQANYLFDGWDVRAIDFDDCGWGLRLYDLAVTLSELPARPDEPALRAALLEEHAARGRLPDGAERHLAALVILRGAQLLVWVIESRDHAAFREEWRAWSDDGLRAIAAAVERL